jgi:hypothetical protein
MQLVLGRAWHSAFLQPAKLSSKNIPERAKNEDIWFVFMFVFFEIATRKSYATNGLLEKLTATYLNFLLNAKMRFN